VSALQRSVERLVARLKNDPFYRIQTRYTNAQLLGVLWYRALQWARGLSLPVRSWNVRRPVFRGRRVVVEHAGALTADAGLILEDGVHISALSREGITLGRNVTIAKYAVLTCTGVLAEIGTGITIGDRTAVGAGSFLGGQGGIRIGSDVIMGPGVRIFSENHRFDALDKPIRTQGVRRRGVTIGDDCWIGAGVTIVDGVTIGDGCVIAAGAVVTSSLPPRCVAGGVPARVIKERDPGLPADDTRRADR
jgi:acetyltransferase-like isoleucine patch superfamily enzyme